MNGFLHDLWWMSLLAGVALLLFGLLAVVWPGLTLASLAVIFSLYVLVAGIMNILVAIASIGSKGGWFLSLLLGIAEICAGVYIMKNDLVLETFIITIGVIFMLQGVFAIISAFMDTKDAGMRILKIVGGALGVFAGFIVLQYPVSGGIAFAWVLGIYGLVNGTILIAQSLSLRQATNELEEEMAKAQMEG